MKTHTLEELKDCRRKLVKMKLKAVGEYPRSWCIMDTRYFDSMEFDADGKYYGDSEGWVIDHAKSKADIAAVFDNSIALLDKRIAALKG